MKLRHFFLGFVSATTLSLAPPLRAGMVPAPELGQPKYTQEEYDANYDRGFTDGQTSGILQCKGDPASCDIRLSDVLTGAEFGETEPNDHIVGADPIVPEHQYWGQSYAPFDQDWFFLTTDEPNQIVTIDFTVPFRALDDNVSGWLIQVRDAAGNIYAEFNTDFVWEVPDSNDEITYPVFLGHVGTYYVVVQPLYRKIQPSPLNGTQEYVSCLPGETEADGCKFNYFPYKVAVVLDYSGMDGTPWDVNFYDVETEPNDTRDLADPIATGVTVYGMLHTTLQNVPTSNGQTTPRYIQSEEDWFAYNSPGNEAVNLAICGRENCDEGTWFITVENEAGANLLAFNTKTPQVVRFGLADAGNYYMKVGFEKGLEAECVEYEETPGCLKEEFICPKGEKDGACIREDPDGKCLEYEKVPCNIVTDDLCDPIPGAVCTEDEFEKICTEVGEVCKTWAPTQDANARDVEYNFTWWGTKLPPHTAETPDYEEFLEPPNWYQGR